MLYAVFLGLKENHKEGCCFWLANRAWGTPYAKRARRRADRKQMPSRQESLSAQSNNQIFFLPGSPVALIFQLRLPSYGLLVDKVAGNKWLLGDPGRSSRADSFCCAFCASQTREFGCLGQKGTHVSWFKIHNFLGFLSPGS